MAGRKFHPNSLLIKIDLMKILIVAPFFPPKNGIAPLRPYSWAKFFALFGHDVTVLTTKKVPQENALELPCDGFEVIEVTVPGMAWATKFLGKPVQSQQQDSLKSNHLSWSKRIKNLLIRAIRKLQQQNGILYACRMPEIHDLWAIPAYKKVSSRQWDIVISTAWPYSAHWVGWWLKTRGHAKKWVADWRDLWTDNHLYPGLLPFTLLEKFLEKKFNRAADLITTVSEPLANRLRQQCGNKVTVIYNGFDPDDYARLPKARIFPDDGKFRIVYTGTIYSGKRDPSPLFEAIRKLDLAGKISPETLEVLFAGISHNLETTISQQGVSHYVRTLGTLPRENALRMQRDANALLFLEFEAPGVEGILTGKLFEYLYAPSPILAIGITPASSAGSIIEDCGKGWALGNDVNKISLWLESMLANAPAPLPVSVMEIGTFSRETQARKLLDVAAI